MGRHGVMRGISARATMAAACSLLGACTAPVGKAPQSAVVAAPAVASASGDIFSFPEAIVSPLDIGPLPASLSSFIARCRAGDAALSRAAERFARRQSEGGAPLDVSELTFALRAEGSPYVWPRAWTLEGGDLTGAEAQRRMQAWLDDWSDGGERRCGIALTETRERSVLAAVAVDVLADLDPLPVRVRSGAWLEVSASLLVAATDAKFVLLGPSGTPHSLPTSFDGGRARARFRADRPGPFLVQLLATVPGGPRPLLEATVYSDVNPPNAYSGDPAPGEPSVHFPPGTDLAEALLLMLNQARASEHAAPLTRDRRLDDLAARHAEAMRQLKRITHDAGEGDPRSRVEVSNIDVLAAGENVAHASDVRRAHRNLWASPSHRENLLQPRFDRVGIGVAADVDGSIWVCQIFADFPER